MDTNSNLRDNGMNTPNATETVTPVLRTPPMCPTYPQPRQKKSKKEIPFHKKDKVFMGLFILAATLTVFFGLFGGFSLGLTVSVWVLTLITAIYLKDNGDFSVLSVSALVGTLISSLSFTFYGFFNDFSSLLAALLTIVCYTVFAVSMCDGEIFDSIKGFIKYAFVSIVSPYLNIAVPIKNSVSKDKDKRKSAIQVFAAILVSVPVLCVVIPLLVSSDAAFEGLISLAAEKIGMTLLKLFITLLLSALLTAFIVTNRFDMFDRNGIALGKPQRPLKSLFAVTFLSLLSAVYLAFLFSQLAYFVNSFKGLLPEGFTFADYARRGFFETETVAFINLAIIVLLMSLTKRNEQGGLPVPVKILMTFISVFSIFFVATAFAKMAMYIKTYGLTSLRLFTSVFMVATCAFIIAFIVRIYNIDANTVKYAISFSLVIFSLLSAVGIERTIASYNVNAYLSGKHTKIDLEYLYNLGESAIPYIAKLTDCPDSEVSSRAEICMEPFFYSRHNKISVGEDEYKIKNGLLVREYHKDYRFNLNAYRISKMYEKEKIKYKEKGRILYPFSQEWEPYIPLGYYDSTEDANYAIENSTEYTEYAEYNYNDDISDKLNGYTLVGEHIDEVSLYNDEFAKVSGKEALSCISPDDYYVITAAFNQNEEYSLEDFCLYIYDTQSKTLYSLQFEK